jgi:hypothetical protein
VSLARLTHVDPGHWGLACLAAGRAWDLLAATAAAPAEREALWRAHARTFEARPAEAASAFAAGDARPVSATDAALCAVRDALQAGTEASHPGPAADWVDAVSSAP